MLVRRLGSTVGLGVSRSRALVIAFGHRPGLRLSRVPGLDKFRLRLLISRRFATGRVVREVSLANVHLKILNGSYKGRRFRLGLPTRGQSTRTNAATANHFYRLGTFKIKEKS